MKSVNGISQWGVLTIDSCHPQAHLPSSLLVSSSSAFYTSCAASLAAPVDAAVLIAPWSMQIVQRTNVLWGSHEWSYAEGAYIFSQEKEKDTKQSKINS